MHRVQRQDHAHVASCRKEVHLVADVVWLNAGNEIGPVSVGDRLARNDLGIGEPRFRRQRHPRLLHELNLRRIDRRHWLNRCIKGGFWDGGTALASKQSGSLLRCDQLNALIEPTIFAVAIRD